MSQYEEAILAGGCFWCMVQPFDQQLGVESVVSGYTGGHTENPSYEEVSVGNTGHTEAVKITYDATLLSYDKILDIFWSSINPTDAGGQFYDRGDSYRPEIFYTTLHQKKVAEASKQQLEASNRFDQPIVVPITKANKFYEAEEYHQNYYLKNPLHYQVYAQGSGRQQFIDKHY